MASVATGLNVRGLAPLTTTSTVRHTPSNAAGESLAVNDAAAARSIVVLTTDKNTRTLELFVIGPSLALCNGRFLRDSSLQCGWRALKRHQASRRGWRLMAHRCAMLSMP